MASPRHWRTRNDSAAVSSPDGSRRAGYRAHMTGAPVIPRPGTTATARESLLPVLDLFAGAGGLSRGFTDASQRFVIARAVESDPVAAATYAVNHGQNVVFHGTVQDWLQREPVPHVAVVVGGPPCQGFSPLGSRDPEDQRNQLWLRYAEVIRRARPLYFLLENVPAFLQSAQYQRLRRQCHPSGPLGQYALEARVLNAADHGVPQLRRRAVVIGHHRDLPAPGFPPPSSGPQPTLKDALASLPEHVTDQNLPTRRITVAGREFPGAFHTDELHLTRHYENISLQRFAHIPAGGNRFDIPERLLPPCWRNHRTGAWDVMGRLSWDRPAVTIRTEFHKPEKGRYLHPTEPRALTHHEAARIQGFPDNYQWVGSKTSIARQIGNAVPVPLATWLARWIVTRLG